MFSTRNSTRSVRRHDRLILCFLIWFFSAPGASRSVEAQQITNVVPQTGATVPTNIQPTDAGAEIFGSLSLSTDNRSQGFTSSNQENAIQFDVGVIWKQFYAGVSASNVDFGQTILADGSLAGFAYRELTYYAGYVNVFNKLDYDVGFSYATFPGARDSAAELNYWEITAGVGRAFGEDMRGGPLRAGLRVNYAADYSADSGDNFVFEGTLEKPLGAFRNGKIKPALKANVGYQNGEENRGNIDYWFWSAGLDVKVHDKISLDLRYHDSAEVPFSCADLCDSAFVATLTYEFSANLGGRRKVAAMK